jgi:transcriptional regulator with XRE-family HTH domain
MHTSDIAAARRKAARHIWQNEDLGFPERLAALREWRGFSQTKLAEAINVDRTLISRYESGNRHPNLATLAALSIALDCPVHDLLADVDGQQRSSRWPAVERWQAERAEAIGGRVAA